MIGVPHGLRVVNPHSSVDEIEGSSDVGNMEYTVGFFRGPPPNCKQMVPLDDFGFP